MGMNIKNERVHALAREAARVTGGTVTSAVEEGLKMLLESYGTDLEAQRRKARMDVILSITAEFNADLEGQPPLTTEDLYDPATGLPQ